MTRDLRKILKMLAEKYPANYNFENMINPAILIYDDQSGAILKDATKGAYERGNRLADFHDIKELVERLQNDTAST